MGPIRTKVFDHLDLFGCTALSHMLFSSSVYHRSMSSVFSENLSCRSFLSMQFQCRSTADPHLHLICTWSALDHLRKLLPFRNHKQDRLGWFPPESKAGYGEIWATGDWINSPDSQQIQWLPRQKSHRPLKKKQRVTPSHPAVIRTSRRCYNLGKLQPGCEVFGS